ncbi:MAG: anti-sigma factor [Chloroflexota bacterium]
MTRHPIDPVDLSAYHDGALEEADRRRVEEHLALCPSCQERLDDYGWIGCALRASGEVAVPASLDFRVRALLREEVAPRPRLALPRLWAPRPAMAAVVLAGLMVALLLTGLPLLNGGSGPLVAAAFLYQEQGEPAIEVQFTAPVDRDSVVRSLQVDQGVEVDVTWRNDKTMVVKPKQPQQLQPARKYTLSLKPRGEESAATPVALQFSGDLPTTPVPLATQPAPGTPPSEGIVATGTATPGASATTAAVASATPPATATARPASTATPRPTVQPLRGFGVLYGSQPQVAARLGPAFEPEQAVALVVQPFQRGRLIWRADRKEIIALLEGGQWRSYPDSFDGTQSATPQPEELVRGFGKLWRDQTDLRSALGTPTAPEQPTEGAMQQFERGTLLRTPDHTIFALHGDMSWEQFPDSYQEPTPTASPTATVTSTPTTAPSPTPTATPSATSTVTPSAAVSATPVGQEPTATATTAATPEATSTPMPSAVASATPEGPAASPSPPTPTVGPERGFGDLHRDNQTVAEGLGAARAPEVAVQLARQTFERGMMLRRSDTREIFALRRDGSWLLYRDSWQEGEPLRKEAAPTGLLAPTQGFGKLWRQQPELRQSFGWATAIEQTLPAAAQQFAGGRMLWTSDRVIYVLYSDGSWQSFPDGYETPTPSPGVAVP